MPTDYYLSPYGDRRNPDGQPSAHLNSGLRAERGIDEMLGICKGLICDGVLVKTEADFLKAWMEQNPDAVKRFPGSVLYDRLQRIYRDNVVTDEEREDLKQLLQRLTGEDDSEVEIGQRQSTKLAFDDPQPDILFPEKSFCFTGKFVSGTRSWCEQEAARRGGTAHDKPRVDTNFLVIGVIASRDWAHTSFGRKIETALHYRQKYDLKIVAEKHWLQFLNP